MGFSFNQSSTTNLIVSWTFWHICIPHLLRCPPVQKSSLDKHFQSCYCQKQVGQVGIDNYSSETYWQVIIFAWMYSPEGVDNRYTKRITGENVGSTASVARNSHAMVTLVIFFSFFSRHKKGILFKCFWSDMGFGTAHALKFWYKSYIREFLLDTPFVMYPCYWL